MEIIEINLLWWLFSLLVSGLIGCAIGWVGGVAEGRDKERAER